MNNITILIDESVDPEDLTPAYFLSVNDALSSRGMYLVAVRCTQSTLNKVVSLGLCGTRLDADVVAFNQVPWLEWNII